MLQHAATSVCTLVVGMQGSGKTTFALRLLVASMPSAYVFAFDPRGDISERLRVPAALTQRQLIEDD